jgi:hypothetical protein
LATLRHLRSWHISCGISIRLGGDRQFCNKLGGFDDPMVGFGGELSIYSRYVFLFHIISASYFKRVEEPLSPKKKMEKKKELCKRRI